jgi:hypothetical protein
VADPALRGAYVTLLRNVSASGAHCWHEIGPDWLDYAIDLMGERIDPAFGADVAAHADSVLVAAVGWGTDAFTRFCRDTAVQLQLMD